MSLPVEVQQALMRFGFIPDAEVTLRRRAPLGDPNVYSVDGSEVALRAETARHILVSPVSDRPERDLP